MQLIPVSTARLITDTVTPSPLPGAVWHESATGGEGLVYDFEPGALAEAKWLTGDFLTMADTDLALVVELHEPGNPLPFVCRFTLLPKAQARLRLNLEAVNLNRWLYRREGACLKPTISGGRVELKKVSRIFLKVLYKGPVVARWCMTPLQATIKEPPVIEKPLLPAGPLLDRLGQATWRHWPGKTPDETVLKARLAAAHQKALGYKTPATVSSWGGWSERREKATGFFRTHHDGVRWWLVDPDGALFWSTGTADVNPKIDSNVRRLHAALEWMPPVTGEFAAAHHKKTDDDESVSFLTANLIRAFGPEFWRQRWEELVFPLMREIGFNSCGNWSDCDAARRARMPYVYPMPSAPDGAQVARVFRDFPDVFAEDFAGEAEAFAAPLVVLTDDPAMIGYFLMNEPMWAFTDLFVAEGMLWNSPRCATRRVFAEFLKQRHGSEAGFVQAWGMPVSLADVAEGVWTKQLTPAALVDVKDFSGVMARKLYTTLGAACRKADGNHLNLGARFSSAPKDWVAGAMKGCFDVFSINCYKTEADPRLEEVCRRLNIPALIGEWHFGALDVGLPAPGIGHVATQADRGRMYRCYVEASAARPWCVGAHWFTLYDQSALGRSDGENYNIGFVDVCHRIYEPLADAARLTHERLYRLASGELDPFTDAPAIIERLNM